MKQVERGSVPDGWDHLVGKAGNGIETVKACLVVNATEEWVRRAEKETDAKMKSLKVGYSTGKRKSSEVFN